MWAYDDNWLASFRDIQALGGVHRQEQPRKFDEMALSTEPAQTIILSMTSGTTSLPKFAEVTHHQLVYGHGLNDKYVDSRQADNWLSFSPMAWLAEQAFGYATHLLNGVQVNFPEGPKTVPTDMREIAPAGLLFPSRVWEKPGAGSAIPHQRQQSPQSLDVSALHAHRLSRYRPGRRAAYDTAAIAISSLAGRVCHLRAFARQAGIDAGAQCADSRRDAQLGHHPLLPRHWHRIAAILWLDRDLWHGTPAG